MELVAFFFFVGLISGIIGIFLGGIVEKGVAGFWLGAFLGPIGWIIVFLLPRDEESPNHQPNPTIEQQVSRTSAPQRDLSSDAYKIWLGKKYSITKNDLFEKYECDERLFETLDEALSHADGLEQERAFADRPSENDHQKAEQLRLDKLERERENEGAGKKELYIVVGLLVSFGLMVLIGSQI